MSKPLHEIYTLECLSCGLPQTAAVELGSAPPEDVVCPHCLVGLSVLRRDNEEWVRIARVDLPGQQAMWLVVTDEMEEKLKDVSFERINHGDVFESDEIGVTDDDADQDILEIRGQVSRRIKEGVQDFDLTPALLENERIVAILDYVHKQARERANPVAE